MEPTGSKISQIGDSPTPVMKNTSGLRPGTPQVACASKRTLQTMQKSLNITAVSSWHTSSWRSAAMTGPATGTGDIAATFKNSFNGAGNTDVTPSSQFWNLPDDFCGDRKGKTNLHTCTQHIPASLFQCSQELCLLLGRSKKKQS